MFPKIGTGKLTRQDPDRNLFVRLCNSGTLNGMAIDGQFLIVAKGTPFATLLVRSAEQTTEKPPLRFRWSRSGQQADHSGLCLTPFLIRPIKALTKIADRAISVA